jgi:hypothetical protein
MLDITKPVQTREGRPVRLICTDRRGTHPLIGLISEKDEEKLGTWMVDGSRFDTPGTADADLINVLAKHRGWVNVFRNGPEDSDCCVAGSVYPNKHCADLAGQVHKNFVTSIEIEWED